MKRPKIILGAPLPPICKHWHNLHCWYIWQFDQSWKTT